MTSNRVRLTRDIPSFGGTFKAGTVLEILSVNVGDGYESIGPFGRKTKVPRITGLPADSFEIVTDGEPVKVLGSAEPQPQQPQQPRPSQPQIQSQTASDPNPLDDLDLEGLV